MAGDWLKLHRRAIESQVFSDPHLWHLFCWCLLRANWKRGYFKGVEIPPGSFACGRNAAAEELGVNASTWYKRIQKLESMGVISLSGNNRFTTITVQKWAYYQDGSGDGNNEVTTKEQPSNNQVTTKEQPGNTIEEGNKAIREEGKITHTHSQRQNQKLEIPPDLAIPFSRWAEWIFATTGQAIPNIQAETLLMDLGRRGADKATRDVDFSINKGAKSILDSDNDFQRRQSATATYSKPVRKRNYE
jgi:hypothetical protein